MMQGSKLMFSDTELRLATNREFILTKNAIIQKVYDQFGHLGKLLFEVLKPMQITCPEVFGTMPKISKGENYMGFPWVMLDYPRFFHKEEGHCALRTFFWWGHYYLVQIQVSHRFKERMLEKIENWRALFQSPEDAVWIGFPDDPYNFVLPQEGLTKLCRDSELPSSGSFGEIFKIVMPVTIEKGQHLEVILPLFAGLFFDSD